MSALDEQLPTGWTRTTLAEVSLDAVAQEGPRQTTFTYVDIGAIDNQIKRIVAPKTLASGLTPSRARQNLIAGDVLVSMTRPNLNAVAILPGGFEDPVGSTGLHVLRPHAVESSWLALAVQTRDFVDAMCEIVQGATPRCGQRTSGTGRF